MKDKHLASLTVLYAEDEEMTRSSLERFLAKRVKHLYVAQNGKEGLDLFRSHKPDIVVTDIRMPIMDGLSMARQIREICKETPIVVTTAFNDETYFLESIDIGVDKYVKKPINTLTLLDALTVIATNITMQQELDAARKRIEEQYLIMKEEMSMAAHFQQKMMPKKESLAPNDDFDLAYFTHSYSQVSGDFLIIENLDKDHLGMLLIDVMGHGVAAGLVTIELKTIFEDIKSTTFSPAQLLKAINERILCLSDNTMFFTASYAIYDRKANAVTVSSAGGLPFIYFNAKKNSSEICFLEGDPIGLFVEKEFLVREKRIELGAEDLILIQTDGFIETFNDEEEKFDSFFSQKNFMQHISRKASSRKVIEGVLEAVDRHKGKEREYSDDATIIVFKKK